MTKETKIGLIVGLAFIILFAIILSEKGATNSTLAPTTLTVADAGGSTGAGTARPEEPLSDAGRLPLRPETTAALDGNGASGGERGPVESPVGTPIPDDDEPILPLPEAVVERLNLPMEESEVPIDATETASGMPPAGADSMSLTDAVASALRASPTDEADAAGSDTFRAAGTGGPPAASGAGRPSVLEDGAAGSSGPMEIIARHRVRPGESLGKIAARYYGRATPARIHAIFDANRDTLASIHTVRADAMLRIPRLDGKQKIAFEQVSHFAPAALPDPRRAAGDQRVRIPEPASDRPSGGAPAAARTVAATDGAAGPGQSEVPAFRWYRVRERDTLSRIARRELGNEKLFVKIYELNRDIIRNKDVIRPGMKIRLPKKVSAVPSSVGALAAQLPGGLEP